MSTPPFPYSCDRRCIRLQGRTLHPNVAWSRTVLNTSARRPSLRKNRRAMNIPTICAPTNLLPRMVCIALKWHPVVNTSSTIPICVGGGSANFSCIRYTSSRLSITGRPPGPASWARSVEVVWTTSGLTPNPYAIPRQTRSIRSS